MIKVAVILFFAVVVSCRQQPQEKQYRYEKSDTTQVKPKQSFIYNYERDSLFEEFIADILDRSKLASLQNEITCINHISKDRDATEIIGKDLHFWLKNDTNSVCRLIINSKEHELQGVAINNPLDTLTSLYRTGCHSLRHFSFNGKQYTYFTMIHKGCLSFCITEQVLYDHENDKVSVFSTISYYFPFGDIDDDERLDYLNFNLIENNGITEATVYSQQDDGSFKLRKNDKDEPLKIRVRLYRDNENQLYQIDLLSNMLQTPPSSE